MTLFQVLSSDDFAKMSQEHQECADEARVKKQNMERERKDELQKAKYRREEAKTTEKRERKLFTKMKARLFAEERRKEEEARYIKFRNKVNYRILTYWS